MQFTKIILSASAFASAMAITGDVTYYSVAVGACGGTNVESEYVVAIGHGLYEAAQVSSNPNDNPYCGKQVTAYLPETGKTVTATVVDKCGGCADNDLDFSGGAWDDLTKNAAPTRFTDLEWSFL